MFQHLTNGQLIAIAIIGMAAQSADWTSSG